MWPLGGPGMGVAATAAIGRAVATSAGNEPPLCLLGGQMAQSPKNTSRFTSYNNNNKTASTPGFWPLKGKQPLHKNMKGTGGLGFSV